MQIGVRLLLAGGRTEDVRITAEESATIGDVAAAIRRLDPFDPVEPIEGDIAAARPESSACTLAVVAEDGALRRIAAGASFSLDVLAPGDRVRVVELDADDRRAVRATLRVLSGPEAGCEVALRVGVTTIGRGAAADVSFSDPAVSQRHARLHVDSSVEIVDLASANGLRVDGEVVSRARLRGGERVLAGETEFSIDLHGIPVRAADAPQAVGVVRFNRSPLVEQRFEPKRIAAPEPPVRPTPVQLPWLALLAPVVAGIAFLALPGAGPLRVLFLVLAPATLLVAFAVQRAARRRTTRAAATRFERELAEFEDVLDDELARERAARDLEAPSTAELAEAIRGHTPQLWTRRREHAGFLRLRLGTGPARSRLVVEMPSMRDALPGPAARLRSAVDRRALVETVPVVERLPEAGSIGIAGPSAVATDAAAALVLQSIALHAPADLVVCAFTAERGAIAFDWLKWLPHVDGTPLPGVGPVLADAEASWRALLARLETLVATRAGDSECSPHFLGPLPTVKDDPAVDTRTAVMPDPLGRADPPPWPTVLVLVADDAVAERGRLLRILERGAAVGVHAIWVGERVSGLPAVCRTTIGLTGDRSDPAGDAGECGAAAEIGFVRTGSRREAEVELVPPSLARALALELARVVDTGTSPDPAADLPDTVPLASLLGDRLFRSPDALLERWHENDSVIDRADLARPRRPSSLQAVIGAGPDGPLRLGLRRHGPHALVGGTTGSGKSELLRAWVVSLAAESSPDRLSFLLVDYKGGAAFRECADLPHCVGVVTDLDARLATRALTSLRAELRHRERLFLTRGVRELEDLEASGDPTCPPSLVIVIDEFAALVRELPAFVDGVLDLAQRGRSLGIHLILATQRPAGVVSEHVRANASLRVALRTAERQDSVDIVGKPLAAEFDPAHPGRAVIALGASRWVAFQAGRVSGRSGDAPPKVRVEPLRFGIVRPWSEPGQPGGGAASGDDPAADLPTFVETARAAARAAGIPAPRRPWLAPLAERVDLTELVRTATDGTGFAADRRGIVLGLLDEPAEQRRSIACWRPASDGNLAVYGAAGAGKSTMLRSAIVSAALDRSFGEFEAYGIDGTADGLAPLESLPQVGSIVDAEDDERVRRLLTRLENEIELRSRHEGGPRSFSEPEMQRRRRILLLLDGVPELRREHELRASPAHESIRRIMAEGPRFGVHTLLAADRPSALSSALAPTVGRSVALRLPDEQERRLLGVPPGLVDVPVLPGRGVLGGLEFQAAMFGGLGEDDPHEREFEALGRRLAAAGVRSADPVGRLPRTVDARRLPMRAGEIPIGIAADDLGPIGISPRGTFLIAGPPGSGRTTALETILRGAARTCPGARFALFSLAHSAPTPVRWDWAARTSEETAAVARALLGIASAPPDPAEPLVLVLEAAADLLGASADPALVALIRTARRSGHLLIAEGEASTLVSGWPGLAELRSARRGLALHLSASETDAILKLRLPMEHGPRIPGRGVLVEPGRVRALQIARWA